MTKDREEREPQAAGTAAAATRLYPRLLGSSWSTLAPALQRVHLEDQALRAAGTFRVSRASGWVTNRLLDAARVPPSSDAARVRLEVAAWSLVEHWQREIDGILLVTRQSEAPGGLLAERYGPLEFRFRLAVDDGALIFRQESLGVRIGAHRVPLPGWLSVEIAAREAPAADSESVGVLPPGPSPLRTSVDVRMIAPSGRLLFAYRGTVDWLPRGAA